MDAGESARVSKRLIVVGAARVPVLAEKNNAFTTRRPQTREVNSRYKSPTPSRPAGQMRFSSPNPPRTASAAVPIRAQSAERKRLTTPSSPSYPSTPVQDSSVDVRLSSRKSTSGRLPDSLWPSTMRSLSVSFQSDTISIPVSRKEKPDRTLRPSSNVSHKLTDTPTIARKSTPETEKSPLKGKNNSDQLENSKPVDGLPSRLKDQHRWPSRVNGKVSSSGLTRSVDLGDKKVRTSMLALGMGPSLRRPSTADGMGKPLQKSASKAAKLISLEESSRVGFDNKSIDDNFMCKYDTHKLLSAISTDRMTATNKVARSCSLPSPGSRLASIKTSHPPSPKASRPQSPSRTPLSSSSARGTSPSRTRPSTPPSRGVSPSRSRMPNSASQSSTSTSILSFLGDFHKVKKGASYIEDAHQLRLLHNRCLQWQFANARAEAVHYIQKVTAERILYNVWTTTLALWDSVTMKRVSLQQLKLELKLNSILNKQVPYLDDWGFLEIDHLSYLSGAVEDLEASTLRLPVTGGARADIKTMEAAVSSAVDVMQAMGSSICFLLSRVEVMNCFLSEISLMVAQERTMLDECENQLASVAAMQVVENSLRTNLIQMQPAFKRGEQQMTLTSKSPP